MVAVLYNVGKCLLSDKLLHARMTQQELAERLGITRQQINTYTRKENRKVMSLSIAKNISVVLRCEIEDLYEWIPVKVRDKRL